WTGIVLADLLRAAALKPSAVYTAHYGADLPLSGEAGKSPLSRGMPIKKALDGASMLVWAMNGKPLESIHGAPLRLVVPGWPTSLAQEGLSGMGVGEGVHGGGGMGGTASRIPRKPVGRGGRRDEANFKILESMPVRGFLTNPANGTRYASGTKQLRLRG